MSVIVEHTLRRKKVGDKTSPLLNYLKRKAGTSRLYDIHRLSQVDGRRQREAGRTWHLLYHFPLRRNRKAGRLHREEHRQGQYPLPDRQQPATGE